MRMFAPPYVFGLVATSIGLLALSGATSAAPAVPVFALAANDADAPIQIRDRRYVGSSRVYDPPRIYRVPPLGNRVIEYRRPLPHPPMIVYEPPVYGWGVPPWGTPPRPASCGKYRHWDGSGCESVHFGAQNIGPRW